MDTPKSRFDKLLRSLYPDPGVFREDYPVYFRKEWFERNVIGSMDPDDYAAYKDGKGGELDEYEKRGRIVPMPMSSVASSSRFCYLSLRDADFSAFGIDPQGHRRRFEHELRIPGIGGTAPQMDAYVEDGEGGYYFFECKCHEFFDDHDILLSPSYFGKGLIVDCLKDHRLPPHKGDAYPRYSPALFGLEENPRFDLKQLLTHVMGIQARIDSLQRQGKPIREVKLIYFYFIPDAVLVDPEIKTTVDRLWNEVRTVFASPLLPKDIRFECHAMTCDNATRADRSNTVDVLGR